MCSWVTKLKLLPVQWSGEIIPGNPRFFERTLDNYIVMNIAFDFTGTLVLHPPPPLHHTATVTQDPCSQLANDSVCQRGGRGHSFDLSPRAAAFCSWMWRPVGVLCE